jgi:hypothetical protein
LPTVIEEAALVGGHGAADHDKADQILGHAGAGRVAPPMFGQYSDEVLPANGYSAAETASLRERGIVR